jgi:hypothetical protein
MKSFKKTKKWEALKMGKNNKVLTSAKNGNFEVVNIQLFNGLYNVYVYEKGELKAVFKSGSMVGNQANLKEAAAMAQII